MRRFGRVAAAAAILMVLGGAAAAAGAPERFTGRVVNVGGPASGQTWTLTVQADRFTSDEEVSALATVLANEGEKELMTALRATEPAGWIRVGHGTSYHLRVIRSVVTPDGTRVVRGFTDRPIQIAEIFGNFRTQRYTLGMVEMVFHPDGSTSGTLLPLSQIRFTEDGRIEVKTFGTQPAKVLNLKAEQVQEKG